MNRSRFRIGLNIVIALASIGAWLVMVFSNGGMLTDTGLASLKFFTVLSNIFEGTACIIWIAAGRESSQAAEKIKYMATVSVALTFMTVMVFLGPADGTRYFRRAVPHHMACRSAYPGGQQLFRQKGLWQHR